MTKHCSVNDSKSQNQLLITKVTSMGHMRVNCQGTFVFNSVVSTLLLLLLSRSREAFFTSLGQAYP